MSDSTDRLTEAALAARDQGDSATLFTIAMTALANCDRVRSAYGRLDSMVVSPSLVPSQRMSSPRHVYLASAEVVAGTG